MSRQPETTETTDEALQQLLGSRLRGLRLNRNESQTELARRAGIGKATLQRLEEGRSGTIVTLMRVLRALGLDNLDALVPAVEESPLAAARGERQARVRARARSAPKSSPPAWRWGDEE
jgi:putative transcriptional regulator